LTSIGIECSDLLSERPDEEAFVFFFDSLVDSLIPSSTVEAS